METKINYRCGRKPFLIAPKAVTSQHKARVRNRGRKPFLNEPKAVTSQHKS